MSGPAADRLLIGIETHEDAVFRHVDPALDLAQVLVLPQSRRQLLGVVLEGVGHGDRA